MPSNPLNIAIAGLGTVGGGVYQFLQEHGARLTARTARKIVIKAICDLDERHAKNMPRDCQFIKDARKIASMDDIDVVVELIGGADGIAEELISASLEKGKNVVTANKALLAKKGEHLFALAHKHSCHLAFEAAVAGGIPVIKSLREGMMVNHIQRITGILNGTCNYILTEMSQNNKDFKDVLKTAQDKGYAEADPSMDINGDDAAHKLTLLCALAWGKKAWNMPLAATGITSIDRDDIHHARELGYVIRHLADAVLFGGDIIADVSAQLIEMNHPLAHVSDVTNGVLFASAPLGPLFLQGYGAGREATASAVIADITDIARNACFFPAFFNSNLQSQGAQKDPNIRSFYMRLKVEDKAGVLAQIGDLCAQDKISLKKIIQHDHKRKAQLVMLTHPAPNKNMDSLLAKIKKLPFLKEEPHILPVFTI